MQKMPCIIITHFSVLPDSLVSAKICHDSIQQNLCNTDTLQFLLNKSVLVIISQVSRGTKREGQRERAVEFKGSIFTPLHTLLANNSIAIIHIYQLEAHQDAIHILQYPVNNSLQYLKRKNYSNIIVILLRPDT